ncbi:hypothetical protein [Sphingopyxis panaciterrulae]|uniref:Uncharacterized protein n=1 Tax=Sphingopyxis panaciterrulae TaxID=462372 RepID=A0A7W9B8Z1_9SPHN|nr:hypothetical protein [Sphingopyxis panaciterrulae]MBB5708437.1 hypothetical protein [Sphingopyxis panaciterrulae]
MITQENNAPPEVFEFDVAIAAVGYERRCRYIVERYDIRANRQIGLEFGFLKEASFDENQAFFSERSWEILDSREAEIFDRVAVALVETAAASEQLRLFVDISSMSREMMANLALAIDRAQATRKIALAIAYAPAQFGVPYKPAPIRLAAPVKPELAGWSSRPDKPLGVIMGLGCEPGLGLGALQVLEPHKAWLHAPRGFDHRFEDALVKANEHIDDIFDVTEFDYELAESTIARGRIEALMNSVDRSFRLICIPFGPKIFAWLVLSTVVFQQRRNVGVWSFSSREHAQAVDRSVSDEVIWHQMILETPRD